MVHFRAHFGRPQAWSSRLRSSDLPQTWLRGSHRCPGRQLSKGMGMFISYCFYKHFASFAVKKAGRPPAGRRLSEVFPAGPILGVSYWLNGGTFVFWTFEKGYSYDSSEAEQSQILVRFNSAYDCTHETWLCSWSHKERAHVHAEECFQKTELNWNEVQLDFTAAGAERATMRWNV